MRDTPQLNHLAIIPDGNRRWARQHMIKAQKQIYQKGGDKVFEIVEAAFNQGVPNVTFWASSYANLVDRPKDFVSAMEEMYKKNFLELAEHPLIHSNEVRIEIQGEWRDLLAPETVEAMQIAIDKTAHYEKRLLTVLAGYDGSRERGAAVSKLLDSTPDKLISDMLAANSLLRQASWTGNLPDVDLIIRTGAWQDPHNSAGFLSLIADEAQFAFPSVLWPDFSPDQLAEIIDNFKGRERRKGS